MSSDSQSSSSAFFLFSSALCFAFSGGAGLMGFVRRKQLDSLQSAHAVHANNISSLKQDIEASAQKRMYIKLAGKLASESPLKLKTSSGAEHSAILSLNEVVYLQGLSVTAPNAAVKNISTADEVTIEVKAGNGPKPIVDPRCLELMNRDHIDTEETEIGSRLFSAALSLVGVSWPYRCVTSTMIVPQNRHAFVALDATVDLNGNISLVKPNSWYRAPFVTADQYTTVEDDLRSSSRNWTTASVTSGIASIALAFVGVRSSK